jgi:hypothetical protein
MINRPSGTAEGIAYMRYYESLRPAVSPPEYKGEV